MNLFDLTGKTAVVIGGSSTLGGVIAWDRILDTNTKSVMLACQVFGKHMVERDRALGAVYLNGM